MALRAAARCIVAENEKNIHNTILNSQQNDTSLLRFSAAIVTLSNTVMNDDVIC